MLIILLPPNISSSNFPTEQIHCVAMLKNSMRINLVVIAAPFVIIFSMFGMLVGALQEKNSTTDEEKNSLFPSPLMVESTALMQKNFTNGKYQGSSPVNQPPKNKGVRVTAVFSY